MNFLNLDRLVFLGANRNFSASIGSFQRLPAEVSEVILLSQRLALTYSTTFKGVWQAFFQSFLRFFRICIQEPVFCSKLPGFSGRFARFLLIYIVIKGPPCRRMHNSPFGSVLFFLLHLPQGQPDGHGQHWQHANQTNGHRAQHRIIGSFRRVG